MAKDFPKAYEPVLTESKWYEVWLKNEMFTAPSETKNKTYSILMPPPNVTGILHFGHVLNISLQDVYIRWKKMQGYDVCWFPGTDHAGIATQSRVEKELKTQGITRYDLGREKFIEKVWEWREQYGGIILKQLRTLGIFCDWNRTLFTMDESASNAVKEVFIRLFDEGLIYKGKRIINWSPLAQTALSDEEVEFREVKEHLFTLRYHFVDSNEYLKVATVRPETIFGDVAVAVNPHDERYNKFIGKKVIVPLLGREVPVIADDYADPKFGTGCVKITPAHDPNDFEVGLRHNLEQINSMNADGTLNQTAGEFNGVERFKARKLILEKLKDLDLIEKIEDYTHNVGFSQRGGEPVEPFLSDQWFVNMKPLAEIALPPVMNGDIKFYPNHWVKTYENWLTNVRDWCISRQLWWGHRIPVYYSPDGRFTAANNEDEARQKLGLGSDIEMKQDSDVLDTWFSSWLWPLTTMRWLSDGITEENQDLKLYLPTDLLVTAPDIIFFWVARMIMATMKFKNEIPFKNVYFTSTIRDGQGRKLSKSLGNSPDPLNIIDKYGCDAVRFTILYLSPLGQDVKMDVDVEHQDVPSVEIGRNFANKIWNAGRFLLMKKEHAYENSDASANPEPVLSPADYTDADKWILSRLHSTIKNTNLALENFRVDDYTKQLYDFVWRDFCDWYIEILKVQMSESKDDNYRQQLAVFAINLYNNILKMVHPVMPFITEEIYHLTKDIEDSVSITFSELESHQEELINPETEEKLQFLQLIVEEIRRMRSGVGIQPQTKVSVVISPHDKSTFNFLSAQKAIIFALGKCSNVEIMQNADKLENSISSVVRETEIYLQLAGLIDLDKEKERMDKEIQRLSNNISGIEKKLSNEGFLAKAPDNVIQFEKEKLESMKESLRKVQANLESL